MSDIDPMTGQPLNPAPQLQREAGPRGVFEQPKVRTVDPMNMSQEDIEFRHIADMSQLTKFATGDLSRDIPNYLAMRKIGRMMVGLLGEDGQ